MSTIVFDSLDQAKEYIKERIQLSDLVARHTKLMKEPRGFKCLCPLPGHKEKTPSFHVDVRKNLFYCYGCSKGGDIFEFVQQVEGLSFMDALKEFAEQLDVQLPRQTQKQNHHQSETKDSLALLDRAAKFFQKCLLSDGSSESAKAVEYLKERGLGASSIQSYGLGWAPSKRDSISKSLRQSSEKQLAIRTGLVSDYKGQSYDFFTNRLMIPIRDVRGRVVAFSGRSLDPVTEKNPKYKNSPETDLFKKKWVLYGLGEALPLIRQKDFVVVVEGFFDQWSLQMRDIPAVAVMGTALTEDHAKQLKKYCTEVILFLDADDAGQKAVIRSLPILAAEGLDTKVFISPIGKDPDEWLSQHVKLKSEALELQLRSATEGLQWWAELKLQQAEEQGSNSVQIMKSLSEIWAHTTHEAHRRVLAQNLCVVVGMTAEQFYSSMQAFRVHKKTPTGAYSASESQGLKNIAPVDPLSLEILQTWILGWPALIPKTHDSWDRLIQASGPFATVFSELSNLYSQQHGDLSLSQVETALEKASFLGAGQTGARLKRALFEAGSEALDLTRLEKAQEELIVEAEARSIDLKIAEIRKKMKKLPENSPETEQLLHEIEKLLFKRNNHLEKSEKGASVGGRSTEKA